MRSRGRRRRSCETPAPGAREPILVSGASAYRRGEFLYQDYLYDDSGARGLHDPSSPRGPGDDAFSGLNGTYTYPSDPATRRTPPTWSSCG